MTEIRFPSPPKIAGTDQLPRYELEHDKVLQREFDKRTVDTSGRPNFLLVAPDKSVWSVTVDNAGTLATTKVFG